MKSFIYRFVGIIIIIGGVIFGALIFSDLLHDIQVWFFGNSVRGIVTDQYYNSHFDEDWHDYIDEFDVFSVYYVNYQFQTPDEQVYEGSAKIPGMEWWSKSPGKPVDIRYSTLDPTNNRLDDSPYVPFLLCSYIPFLLICIFGIAAGRELLDF